MGLEQFQIEILRNEILSYFPGQTIQGILHVGNQEECITEGIKVTFEGKAAVHWDYDSKTTKMNTYADAEEKYFNCKIYLLGTGLGRKSLKPGHHHYQFQFTLPQSLPSSFVGSYGMVMYEIRAEMKKLWKNYVTKVPFTVNGIVDLNIEPPQASEAIEARKYKNVSCLGEKSGPIGFILRLPKKGYVSGEFFGFTAELSNESSRKVNSVTIYLVQTVNYHAIGKSKSKETTICQEKGPAVEPGTTVIWTENKLRIPPLPPTTLASCGITRIIDVQYTLKVGKICTLSVKSHSVIEMDMYGPAINLTHAIPIVIGSIPLRNTLHEIKSIQPQRIQIQSGSSSNGATADLQDPFSPTKSSQVQASQTLYFQDNYPDLPPPKYAETILQDQFNAEFQDLAFVNEGDSHPR